MPVFNFTWVSLADTSESADWRKVQLELALDVNEMEPRTLLLSIDPLAALAETQEQLHDRLLEITRTESEELTAAWQRAAEANLEKLAARETPGVLPGPEQFLVLVHCRDEKHQVEVLEWFQREGLECRVLVG